MDCRLDVWNWNDMNTSQYNKGERSVASRRCRFPGFHTVTGDADGASYIITVMTEYIYTD